ncbi:MAG: hypothetical protein AB7Q42_23465 [Acidimicrobiia bacterium]
MEGSFFDDVLDIVIGFVADVPGPMRSSVHRRGLKVWFADSNREHYEAQLIRVDGEPALEVGFHAEHPKPDANEAVLAVLVREKRAWEKVLGPDAVAGEFIGAARWRRISELWPVPEDDDVDAAIEVAARLADYIHALERIRRG